MKERLSKLLTVKSIVTLLLTIVFGYLSIIGVISPEMFMTVFTVVIAFYFGTQVEKKNKETTTETPTENKDTTENGDTTK